MTNNNQNFNQYNTDINNTRNNNQNGLNINQNPYINSGVNQNFIGQNTNSQAQNQSNSFLNGDFIKGALIGAVATYILTNKNAQERIFKAFGKGSELFSAGIEELKERYEDAKAQMQANQEH